MVMSVHVDIKIILSTNLREGDATNHHRHLAARIFELDNLSDEYAKEVAIESYLTPGWKENPEGIRKMLKRRWQEKFDLLRNQSFADVFPEVNQLRITGKILHKYCKGTKSCKKRQEASLKN